MPNAPDKCLKERCMRQSSTVIGSLWILMIRKSAGARPIIQPIGWDLRPYWVFETVPFRPHPEGGGAVLSYRAIVIEKELQIQVLVQLRGLLVFRSILCAHWAAFPKNGPQNGPPKRPHSYKYFPVISMLFMGFFIHYVIHHVLRRSIEFVFLKQ